MLPKIKVKHQSIMHDYLFEAAKKARVKQIKSQVAKYWVIFVILYFFSLKFKNHELKFRNHELQLHKNIILLKTQSYSLFLGSAKSSLK